MKKDDVIEIVPVSNGWIVRTQGSYDERHMVQLYLDMRVSTSIDDLKTNIGNWAEGMYEKDD